MGAQHGKERAVPVGNLGNLTTRSVRIKPRTNKDGRLQGNNIFTEHSGECYARYSVGDSLVKVAQAVGMTSLL